MGRLHKKASTQGEPNTKRKYTRKPIYKRSCTQDSFESNLKGIQRRWKSKKKVKALNESENTHQEHQTNYEWSTHMEEMDIQLSQNMQEINTQPSQNIVSFETMLRDPIIEYNFLMENTYEESSSAPTRLEISTNINISDDPL